MGWLDRFRVQKPLPVGSGVQWVDRRVPSIEIAPGQDGLSWEHVMEAARSVRGMSPGQVYRSQPNVRSVVDFLARNVAQLSWHAYRLDPSGMRERDRESQLALLLERPSWAMTGYELRRDLVSSLALWDEAWWIVAPNPQAPSGWSIRPIPVGQIVQVRGSEWTGDVELLVSPPGGGMFRFSGEVLIHFSGWAPAGERGLSPIETLRDLLAEQVAAAAFRRDLWRRGTQVASTIERATDAPQWSSEARAKFVEQLRTFESDGENAGRSLLLEDGMRRVSHTFNAREAQWVEAANLSLETVARAYHVHPSQLGATGGVSYANVKEFRRMLYGDTLAPMLEQIQQRLTLALAGRLDSDPGTFVEFNIKGKLAGSFEEQAAVMSQSTGVPWMTRNEARAKENLPPLVGGDELMTPLNYQVGSGRGDAPKHAAVSATKSAAVSAAGDADRSSQQLTRTALAKFFKRQRRGVLSALGAKSPQWWDGERWDSELADDLFAVAMTVTRQVAADVLDSLGFSASEYDPARTEKFLRAVAASRAGMINAATLARIEDVLARSGEDAPTPADVFDDAEGARGDVIATTLTTTLAGFATAEVGKQSVRDARKTWETGPNARASHAAMDGETVPVDDPFSNGAMWPGDPVLDVDDIAGCNCGVSISF